MSKPPACTAVPWVSRLWSFCPGSTTWSHDGCSGSVESPLYVWLNDWECENPITTLIINKGCNQYRFRSFDDQVQQCLWSRTLTCPYIYECNIKLPGACKIKRVEAIIVICLLLLSPASPLPTNDCRHRFELRWFIRHALDGDPAHFRPYCNLPTAQCAHITLLSFINWFRGVRFIHTFISNTRRTTRPLTVCARTGAGVVRHGSCVRKWKLSLRVCYG